MGRRAGEGRGLGGGLWVSLSLNLARRLHFVGGGGEFLFWIGFVCLSIHIYMYVWVSVFLSICLCLCLSVSYLVYVYLSISLSYIIPYPYLLIFPSVRLNMFVSINQHPSVMYPLFFLYVSQEVYSHVYHDLFVYLLSYTVPTFPPCLALVLRSQRHNPVLPHYRNWFRSH